MIRMASTQKPNRTVKKERRKEITIYLLFVGAVVGLSGLDSFKSDSLQVGHMALFSASSSRPSIMILVLSVCKTLHSGRSCDALSTIDTHELRTPSHDRWAFRFVPEPHPLGGSMRNYINGMECCQPVALFENVFLGTSRPWLPWKGRRECFVGTGARVCAIVMVLCCAQACENITGVVRVRMPKYDGQQQIQTNIDWHPWLHKPILTFQAYRGDHRKGVGNTRGYIEPVPRGWKDYQPFLRVH